MLAGLCFLLACPSFEAALQPLSSQPTSPHKRYTICNVESQVFTRNNAPGPRDRTTNDGVPSGCANHYTEYCVSLLDLSLP